MWSGVLLICFLGLSWGNATKNGRDAFFAKTVGYPRKFLGGLDVRSASTGGDLGPILHLPALWWIVKSGPTNIARQLFEIGHPVAIRKNRGTSSTAARNASSSRTKRLSRLSAPMNISAMQS